MLFTFLTVLFSVFATCSVSADSSLPPPYNKISSLLPFNDFGWYSHHELMSELIRSRNVSTIIEVGSFMGLSTRHLASCLPKGGHLYAVDHWLGSAEHQAGQWAYPPVPLEQLYDYFLSNVIHAGLTDVIIPVRQHSIEAAKTLNVIADLIFVDGSHETDAVLADLNAWYPHLALNGVLVGDDWGWETVREAAHIFAADHPELELRTNGAGYWFFHK